jgi:hypothetical protein
MPTGGQAYGFAPRPLQYLPRDRRSVSGPAGASQLKAAIRVAVLKKLQDLENAIRELIRVHNQQPKPFGGPKTRSWPPSPDSPLPLWPHMHLRFMKEINDSGD